jgi:hypothetical protein
MPPNVTPCGLETMWKAGAYRIACATIVFASILGCSPEVQKPIRIVLLELGLAGASPTLEGNDLLFNKAEVITERALSLFDELTGSKQFIWLQYFDAYNPYSDSGGPDSILHKAFAKPTFEIRTDTSKRELVAYEFFAIHGETIVRGDRNELSTSSSANLGEGEEASLKAAFAVFQDILTGGTAVERLDPDTLRALESLGYER